MDSVASLATLEARRLATIFPLQARREARSITPPQASLGSMLSDAQSYLRNAPWYALSTGCAVALLILGFSLLSEGLQQSDHRN